MNDDSKVADVETPLDSSEQLAGAGSEAQTTQPSEPTRPETPTASPADLAAKFDTQIRDMETRLQAQLEQAVERVNKSNRDATKARFEELKARYDEMYLAQANAINELVADGSLDPNAATAKKMAWREKYDNEVLKESRAREQTPNPQSPSVTEDALRAQQAKRGFELLQKHQIDPNIADYREAWEARKGRFASEDDFEDMLMSIRIKREAAKMVGTKTPPAPSKVSGDAGKGGGGVTARNKQAIAEEMERLMAQPGGDHTQRAERKKRLDELERAWNAAPD